MNELSCPFELTIFPDVLHPPSTKFSVGSYKTVAGARAEFTMSWFDQYGNAVDTDPKDVQVCQQTKLMLQEDIVTQKHEIFH